MAASLSIAAGCGNDDPADEGPLTKAELIAEADELCAQVTDRLALLGPEPHLPAAIGAKYEASATLAQEFQPQFEALEAEGSVAKDYKAYVKSRARLADVYSRIAEAASETAEADFAGDADREASANKRYLKLSEEASAIAEQRDRSAEKIGFAVCSADLPTRVEKTGSEPAEDVTFPQPANTIMGAGKAFLAAVRSGKCPELTALEHSDNAPFSGPICQSYLETYSQVKIRAAEQYGPAGVVETEDEGTGYTIAFVLDKGNLFRHVSDEATIDGGLRPADPDNNGAESAEAWVQAIRDNDPEAYAENYTQDVDSSYGPLFIPRKKFDKLAGQSGTRFVADIRADADAEPVELGINQVYGFYLLEANGRSYVLVAVHQPGSKTDYRVSGFFPIP